jgi:hypothetical protein
MSKKAKPYPWARVVLWMPASQLPSAHRSSRLGDGLAIPRYDKMLGSKFLRVRERGFAMLAPCVYCHPKWDESFKLSDEVLMAAIGGTTITVVGLFLVVARYPFRH